MKIAPQRYDAFVMSATGPFALANGFAVEAIVTGKFSIAFFCSAGCYLMITTDALKYLPQMGLDPSRVVGCAGAKCCPRMLLER
jgi:hypothetical protein